MKFIAALLLGTALAGPAFAMQDTRAGRYDPRVRTVAFNGMNVVRLVASTFISTQIVFATTEVIDKVAIGDREAWAPEPAGNLLFIKPVEVRQPTNMQVVTKRADGSWRTYNFLLIARGMPSSSADKVADLGGTVPETGEVTPFAIHFVYPEDARAEALAKRREAAVGENERLAETRLAVDYFYGPRNWSYTSWGSINFDPAEVSDNGRLTAMRFPGNSPIPTFYALPPKADGTSRICGEDGGKFEQIVSYTMRADVAVISSTARDFCLRSGSEVTQVHNVGYNRVGTNPGTGTTSPEVIRSVRGAP